jgi:hypothetical protein
MLSDSFWNSYVLPISASCKSVQYAIVALATRYRAWVDGPSSPINSSSAAEAFSLLSYGKAIKTLNDRMRERETSTSMVEQTLITCLLFIYFNVLQGNDIEALAHLETVLHILGP